VVSEFLARDGVDDRAPPRTERERVPPPAKREVSDASRPARDAEYELTDEDREWARRIAASLPPLTGRQREVLALLLRKRR